jgi:hypothetical protein
MSDGPYKSEIIPRTECKVVNEIIPPSLKQQNLHPIKFGQENNPEGALTLFTRVGMEKRVNRKSLPKLELET